MLDHLFYVSAHIDQCQGYTDTITNDSEVLWCVIDTMSSAASVVM